MKPRYNQQGEPIQEDMNYYNNKQQKEIDFYKFLKILGYVSGVIIFITWLSYVFSGCSEFLKSFVK